MDKKPRKELTASQYKRKLAYDNEFKKGHYTQIAIRLSKETEGDVIDWLKSRKALKEAIVELVRAEIGKGQQQ